MSLKSTRAAATLCFVASVTGIASAQPATEAPAPEAPSAAPSEPAAEAKPAEAVEPTGVPATAAPTPGATPPAEAPLPAAENELAAAPTAVEAAPTTPVLKFYGFARLDAAYATTRMAHNQFGLWGLSPDADGADEPEFVLNPRWSRFGVDAAVPVGDEQVKVTGKLEIDFHNGGSESRALPRMLHAYGQVEYGDVTVLGGQTWDLFAPLIYGGMEQAIFWYGGNAGDRRAQLRVSYGPRFGDAQLIVAAAAAQSGAVSMADEDADTVVDGIASARPAAQGLLELRYKLSEEGQPLRVGLSGHHGAERLRVGGSEETFNAVAAVAHVELPISFLTLRAEGFIGENMRDLRAGIGQGIKLTDTDGDDTPDVGEAIAAKGGFIQLQADPVPWYQLQLGAGIDNPSDVGAGGRGLNRTVHFANAFKPWKAVTIGLVYDLFLTEYVGSMEDATVHRPAAYTMVSF